MRADSLTLKDLFHKEVRYVIPTFQRPYVWNQADQWEPLWNDVRNTAELYLEELSKDDITAPQAEQNTGTHFMGAVVLQQQLTASAEIETRMVIDGQQRLMTTQILMDATQEVFEEVHAQQEGRRMSRLVLNDHAEGDQKFKLWPSSLDRGPFRAAMTNSIGTADYEDSLIVQAHDFFRLQVREWLLSEPIENDRGALIHGLEATIFGLLEVVVIDLELTDDAFVIFETLNARGTPLLASDLVKNFVLQSATAAGTDPDRLHERYWKPFEDEWWREEIRQGRIVRPRLDVFLNHWLVMETAEETQSHEVFSKFKKYVDSKGNRIEEITQQLLRIGMTYRDFDRFESPNQVVTFFYRWRTVDAGTLTPLLLWLFSHLNDKVSELVRLKAIRALESFLVRRMICRLTTKDYNRLFLELMSRLQDTESEAAAETVIAYLDSQSAESRKWPADREVEWAILNLPLYRLLTRARLRMLLEAVEDELRTDFAEESRVPRGSLTIEHILPQSWRTHWPVGEANIASQAETERERVLHTLGNLTLVNNKLNPKLSNAPWKEKQQALADHTVLNINKELLDGYSDSEWSEITIRERGAVLAEVVAKVWPSPSRLT